MKKVHVNLLNQGTVSQGLELQLFRWMQEKREKYSFLFFEPTLRPISNNRNTITQDFLKSDCDYLAMLDSDMCPKRNVFDLLDLDKPVIGAVYPGWGDNGIRFHVYKLDESDPSKFRYKQYPPAARAGLRRVDAIGTGCIFIKREVLEKIERPFEDIFDDKGCLVANDDLAFCRKCREAGVEVWTHWDYICSHYKTVDLLKVTDLIMDAAVSGIARINKPVEEWERRYNKGNAPQNQKEINQGV